MFWGGKRASEQLLHSSYVFIITALTSCTNICQISFCGWSLNKSAPESFNLMSVADKLSKRKG